MEEYFDILSQCSLFFGISRQEMGLMLNCLGGKITCIAKGKPVFLEGDPAEFVIPYDRQALADYLGVERSAMSAEISKLKKAGRIDCSGSRFRVLAPDKKSS